MSVSPALPDRTVLIGGAVKISELNAKNYKSLSGETIPLQVFRVY